jgi:hypothetical protein
VSASESAHKENDLHAPRPTAPQKHKKLCENRLFDFSPGMLTAHDGRRAFRRANRETRGIYSTRDTIGRAIYVLSPINTIWLGFSCFPDFNRGISSYYCRGLCFAPAKRKSESRA